MTTVLSDDTQKRLDFALGKSEAASEVISAVQIVTGDSASVSTDASTGASVATSAVAASAAILDTQNTSQELLISANTPLESSTNASQSRKISSATAGLPNQHRHAS